MLAAFLIVLIPIALAWFVWMALFVANDPGDQIRQAKHDQFFGPGGPDDPFAGAPRGD